MDKATIIALRADFDRDVAPQILSEWSVVRESRTGRSTLFSYFGDDRRFVLVVGAQETDDDIGLALALGLSYRGSRRLVLVLPAGKTFATLQRAAWLNTAAAPNVWEHAEGQFLGQMPIPSREQTLRHYIDRLPKRFGDTLTKELYAATRPPHLSPDDPAVATTISELIDWLAKEPRIDPAHRQGNRSWQCMGQRVFSISGSRRNLTYRAGIHSADDAIVTRFDDKSPAEIREGRGWH